MGSPAHIFLVPGFFGFANLGDLRYFGHVARFLQPALAEHGLDARIHTIRTRPTASLVERTERLAAAILEQAPEGPLHLVGHSSGGLDARMLVTPGVVLRGVDVEPIAQRVRSVVTVATPHLGTPIASLFSTAAGARMLQVLSLAGIVTVRTGPLPVSLLGRVAVVLAAPLEGRAAANLLAQLYDELLDDLTPERRDAVAGFLADVVEDRSLIHQLRPDAMELVGTLCADRPGVACGSVLTAARHPSLGAIRDAGISPYQQTSRTIYAQLHHVAAVRHGWYGQRLEDQHAAALRAAPDEFARPGANDGIVPTASQPWGAVLDAVVADHLDVIGHFLQPNLEPPHHDWLWTGSGYRRPAFEHTWRAVAGFAAAAAKG